VSGPGNRATKPSILREPTHSSYADGQGASPMKVDLDSISLRGPRVRQAHTSHMHGNRETSKGSHRSRWAK